VFCFVQSACLYFPVSQLPAIIILYSSTFFDGSGVGTQDLVLVMQILYQLSHVPGLSLAILIFLLGSCIFAQTGLGCNLYTHTSFIVVVTGTHNHALIIG
jgi:hypothetical protein